MASVKVKFRYSSVKGKEGTLYYQIIHNRTVRQIKTGYKLFADEWNINTSVIIFFSANEERNSYLLELQKKITEEISIVTKIFFVFNQKHTTYTADDVVLAFENRYRNRSLFIFMHGIISQFKALGRIRTSETYATTLNSFMRFRKGRDILLEEIDSDLMMAYEAYLKMKDVGMNTISFYMRILRAMYNRAVDKGITFQCYPFKHVYTGIEKTVKRALPFKVIKRIKELDLRRSPLSDYARDLFLFSFYTRGMSFVDMAYLKKQDLNNGILSYRRKKTGQRLFIRWEKCMQDIVDKYSANNTLYLLPIIRKENNNERNQYKNAIYTVNRKLKDIGKILGLSIPLTMYVARHSWASAARSKNIPIAVISEGMGHDSETTTQIYLASLDTAVVDEANKLILESL